MVFLAVFSAKHTKRIFLRLFYRILANTAEKSTGNAIGYVYGVMARTVS